MLLRGELFLAFFFFDAEVAGVSFIFINGPQLSPTFGGMAQLPPLSKGECFLRPPIMQCRKLSPLERAVER